MKFINKSIYAFALAGMMGLWSCSQEDVLQGGDVTATGHPVTLTLTVNRGDAQTRTVLSENTATGGLNDVWETGDKLAVYNSDGNKAGELEISEGVGTDTGVFTGTVTSENGQYDFNLWYTDPENTGAVEADGKPIYFNNKKRLVVDLSKMPTYKSVESLSAMDVLSKKVKLNINGNKATLVQDETMQAHLAMARFSLNGIPTGKIGTLTIRDSKGSIASGNPETLYKLQLDLASSGTEGTTSRPEGIVVENVKAGEDIYLAFIPGTYTLSFHMEFEGVSYDYAFTNPTKLEAGVYYNAFTKAEGAEEGTIDGVNIPLQQEKMAIFHLYANFDGADPDEIVIYKKFVDGKASLDLSQPYDSFVGTLDGKKLPAHEGYTLLGWNENDDATSGFTSVITNESPNFPNQYYYAIWEKNDEDPDLSNNPLYKWAETNLERVSDAEYYKGKFAASYKDNGHYYQFGRNVGFENYTEASDCAFVYSSEVEVSAGRGDGTKYISNSGYYNSSNIKQGERPNGFMIPCEGNTSDWWPSSANRTDNWDARATASGYTPSNLYVIDGVKYKVPSVADFKEILPSSDINTAFTSETDVKTINNQFVAFRWKKVKENDAYYLEIKAKVVANKNESVTWDSTSDKLIVTRYFKAAGIIFPYHFAEGVWSKLIQYTGDVDYHWASEYSESTFRRNGYTYNGLMHAALAIPYSNPSYEMTTVAASVHDGMTDDEIDVKLTVKPENNFNKYRGSYWTSDGSRTIMDFIFDDDNKIGTNRLLMTSSKAAAYSVRLIKAE